MIATFVVEMILGVYALLRYRATMVGCLGISILVALAGFQLSEYQVCTGGNVELWARVGFASVTFLPVLGLHIIALLTKKKQALILAYFFALGFVATFIILPTSVTGATCSSNYIVFHTAASGWWTYPVFYFGMLLLGIWYSVQVIARTTREQYTKKERALAWMLAGYLSFMVPMAFVYIYYPEARHAVPSVMCGFAVIFAFMLTFKVLSIEK